MRLFLIASIFFAYSVYGLAQSFQQDIKYTIVANLDAEKDLLRGSTVIDYTNNSQEELDTLFFHLWANAFQDNSSAFAQQQLRLMNREFYFASHKDRGGYEELKASINGGADDDEINNLPGRHDIGYMALSQPLKPGSELRISIEYVVKIPKLFSRFGKSPSRYHMTFWFPSLAVYDDNGWHPMSYLSIGEFYAHHSDFDVKITLPSEYKFASTGMANKKVKKKNTTYEIDVNNVTNFAWFALKDYHQVTIPNRDNSYVFLQKSAPPIWDKAPQLASDFLEWMEKKIGDYPFESLVIVQNDSKSASAMEYSGVVTIGAVADSRELDYYLCHELAHEWFFGGIGFNERDYPWMDEGLATYYEQRFSIEKYGEEHYTSRLVWPFSTKPELNIMDHASHHQLQRGHGQAIGSHFNNTGLLNYGLNSYWRAAAAFRYLEHYLGTENFDSMMASFYHEWKYKNPGPQEMQASFENHTGKDLSWFFDDIIESDEVVDFSIKKLSEIDNRYHLEIDRSIPVPIIIDLVKNEEIKRSIWIESEDIPSIDIEKGDYDLISIDYAGLSPDASRHNNHIKTSGLLKKMEPLTIKMFSGIDDSRKSEIYALPLAWFNSSDGFIGGLGLYNSSFPSKRFQWFLGPMYGIKSGELIGESWLRYYINQKKGAIHKYELSTGVKSFHYQDNELLEYNLRFLKFDPSLTLHFRHDPISKSTSSLKLRSIFLQEETPTFSPDGSFALDYQASRIDEIKYIYAKPDALHAMTFLIGLEHQSYQTFGDQDARYIKLIGVWDNTFALGIKKNLKARLFASYFIQNTERESSSYSNRFVRGSTALFNQGFNDYRYDDYFFNRQDQQGDLRRQINYDGGGFKTSLGSAYSLGQSNDYSVAINLMGDFPARLPRFLPLKLFLDTGYYSGKSTLSDPLEGMFLYSAGVMLDFTIFKLYLPFLNSKAIDDIYAGEGIGTFGKLSFSIHLNEHNPWRILEEVKR